MKHSTNRASLSAEKHQLLKLLLEKKGIGAAQRTVIPRRSQFSPASSSFLQEGLWFLDQLDPGKATYNVPGATRLKGSLHIDVLERTLTEIVRRHESLRTTFAEENGRPVQVIAPASPFHLPVINLEELPEAAREAEVIRLATEEAQKPFDLADGPLFRAFLIRLSPEEHILVLNIHHIVTDGWSMGVFTRELVALYEAFAKDTPPLIPPQGGTKEGVSPQGGTKEGVSPQGGIKGDAPHQGGNHSGVLPELPIQFADFAIWQRNWLQGEVLERQLSYWRKQLHEAPPALKLPTDRPRPQFQTSRGKHKTMTFSRSMSDALRMLTQREDFTLFETLLAAFKILLSYYSGQEDIVVGSPSANRNRKELEGLIGYFVNMLPLRTDLSGNPSFQELLSRVHKSTMEAYAHPDLPFGKLVEELRIARDPSRNPIFQVEFILLTYEHAPAVYGYGFRSPIKRSLEVSGLTLSPVEVESGVAKFDLVVLLWDIPEGISGTFEYNADLFDDETIACMIELFEILLKNIIAQPDARLQAIKESLNKKVKIEKDKDKSQERKKANFQKLKTARRKAAIAITRED